MRGLPFYITQGFIFMTLLARILFAVFLYLYFAVAQGDSLAYVCSMVAGRPVDGEPWLLALGVSAVWLCVCRMVEKLGCRFGLPSFAAHVFIAWGAAALVSIPVFSWAWQAGLVASALVLALLEGLWKRRRRPSEWRSGRKKYFSDGLCLLALFLYLGLGASCSDVDHYEMRTAAHLRKHQEEKACEVGKKELATSPRLFALRAMAMAGDSKGLGERLFSQPCFPGLCSKSLIPPDDERERLLFPRDSLYAMLGDSLCRGEEPLEYLRRCARSLGERKSLAADYYLCGLLLDRRLDEFARELKCFYADDLKDGRSLPLYYSQAMVMYARLRSRPLWVYRAADVEENYRDFRRMGKAISNKVARCNLLRSSYGQTYWWFYFYGQTISE